MQLRTQKEDKFYREKEDLLFKDNKTKREMLEQKQQLTKFKAQKMTIILNSLFIRV